MKCKYNYAKINETHFLEGTNNKGQYDIINSTKEMIKNCIDCQDKCEDRFERVRHLDRNK